MIAELPLEPFQGQSIFVERRLDVTLVWLALNETLIFELLQVAVENGQTTSSNSLVHFLPELERGLPFLPVEELQPHETVRNADPLVEVAEESESEEQDDHAQDEEESDGGIIHALPFRKELVQKRTAKNIIFYSSCLPARKPKPEIMSQVIL